MKQQLGAILYDLPRFLWAIRPSSNQSWVYMRNRDERLNVDERNSGAQCDWQWTSDLHIAKVFPALGRALMKRALRDWPIQFRDEPFRPVDNPQVSFVIGHRGIDRLPHLLLTLQSIAAQRQVSFECIVVEQSVVQEIDVLLPSWVRYLHTPFPSQDMPYSRSWAFNVGSLAAQSEVLVLHDNDMLVPSGYAKEAFARFTDGYEIMNPKRFIFYLNAQDSQVLFAERSQVSQTLPLSIMQNALGGSIAVSRNAYLEIGGFDESFVGWGGEDNEFWERAQTRRVWPYGYLPMVHLWHRMQPGKFSEERDTARLYEERSAIPPKDRIAELTAREFGHPRAPSGCLREKINV